jgi:hypothetical protein
MRNAVFAAGLLASMLVTPSVPQKGAGEEAPELIFDATFNFNVAGAKTLKSLRGSAVLLEYWATW